MAVPAYSQVDVQVRLNGPSGKPPLGVTSKFIDAPNIKAINIVIIALFLSSASLAVLIRTYTKILIIRSTAHEDCKSWFSPFRASTD